MTTPVKFCSKCRRDLPLDQFNKSTAARDGLQSYCRDCNKANLRATRGTLGPRRSAWMSGYRAAKRAYVKWLKASTRCADCGQHFPSESMDFDHLDGDDKLVNISRAFSLPWAVLLAEIAKCELVCSNCHRTRTKARAR